MNMTIRPLRAEEQKYTYAQSQQIKMQTGMIGYLRGDFDSTGTGFYTSWFDAVESRKTDEFKAEFDEVINALRFDEQYGGLLAGRSVMQKYGQRFPESIMEGNYTIEYGFRIDTSSYAYLLRCIPVKGDYNFYCWCFEEKWLNRHLEQAQKGIRFINPHYKELFRIPDGDKIRIIHSDGEKTDYTCRYIDDYHVEIGSGWNSLLHICQFAEIMERNGSTVIPLRSSLPEQCYSVLPDTGELIIIKKGESGYYRTDIDMGDKTVCWQTSIIPSSASAKRRNRPCLPVLCLAGQSPLLIRRIMMIMDSLPVRKIKIGVMRDEIRGKAHHLE